MSIRHTMILPLAACIGLAFGCNEQKTATPETTNPNAASTTNTAPTTATPNANNPTAANPADTTTARSDEVKQVLSDGQIAKILYAVNDAEVDQGKLATSKANDTRVKQFATMMVKDHTDAKNKVQKLEKSADISEADSPLYTTLKDDADNTLHMLKDKSNGTDFERAYVTAQVQEHQNVLDTIDKQLLPNVKNTDLKSLIGTMRITVDRHLSEAEGLKKTVVASR